MTDKIILAADTPKPEVSVPPVMPAAPQPEKSAPPPETPAEKNTSSK
ncbi:MAG: hypothetical protein KGZ73_05465 [Rhizobiales bacterium]|jgi:hypothetical protein|nr:hypothetical protein [Hyphomicrobiales bacterium]